MPCASGLNRCRCVLCCCDRRVRTRLRVARPDLLLRRTRRQGHCQLTTDKVAANSARPCGPLLLYIGLVVMSPTACISCVPVVELTDSARASDRCVAHARRTPTRSRNAMSIHVIRASLFGRTRRVPGGMVTADPPDSSGPLLLYLGFVSTRPTARSLCLPAVKSTASARA